MSTTIATILMAVPPAFLLGWVLSKAFFRHISLTRPNTTGSAAASVATAAMTVNNQVNTSPVSKHIDVPVAATKVAGDKLNTLQKKLAGARANAQSMQSEIQLLKEAAAEREHTVLDLKRKLQTQLALPEEKIGSAPPNQEQYIKRTEDQQATRELRIQELKLKHELEAANTQTRRTVQRFHSWRKKIKPLAVQIRQQRVMIAELREELGRQELEQRGQEAAETHTDLSAQVSQEDLQKLHGIGPAMHKKLNEQGVYRLKQLALMSSPEFSELGKSLGIGQKVLAKHQWTVQARQLLNMPEVVAGTELMGSEALPA